MSFDVAATAYDRFMGRYSRPLAVAFADWTGIATQSAVLDVGCGPGALTEELVERLGAGSVTAVDPSAPFVEAARSRMPGCRIALAAAEDLPFVSEAFDATLAQLVVHFMADPGQGITEMARVTRRGGVVAASVWDTERGRAPFSEFSRAVAGVVRGPDGSDRIGGRQGQLAALLEGAGLRSIEETALTVRIRFTSFEDWWDPYGLGVGPAGAQFAALDADQREAVRGALVERMPEGAFTVEATAWAAKGLA